ncbi:MAG: hypothetical protein IJ140_03490 [Prevotella sp.]|nr:hypothetical protein [Prevotella sp.]
MKKLFLFMILAVVSVTMEAQAQSANRLVVHKGDQTVVGYTLNAVDSLTFESLGEVKAQMTLVSTESNGAVVNVTCSADCEKFFLAYEPANKWDGQGSVADRVKTISHNEISADGEQTVSNLVTDTEYNFYTLAFDKYGIEGEAEMLKVNIESGGAEMFTVSLSNLSTNYVNIKITPKNPEMYYSWILHSKEHYDQIIATSGDMNTFDLSWWNFMSEQTGASWDECMHMDLSKGVTDERSEWMTWDSDYVITVYGIDYNDASPLTETYVTNFHTLKPTPSDNNITVELGDVYYNGVDVKVTTTNDDLYFVGSETAEYVNYFLNNDAMIKAWFEDVHENAELQHRGNAEFKKTVKKPDTDYYLIVIGYNGGPSTELQLIPFHTKKLGE